MVALNGSLTSSAVDLTVNNPLPTIAQVSPNSFLVGSASSMVSLTGTGFAPATSIQVGRTARSTSVISSTQATAVLTAMDLAAPGSLSLVAVNPAPGGGNSSAASITVNNPVPGILSLTPTTLLAGATVAATVTINGSNFLSSSVVQVNGSNRGTTYVSATQLAFQLTVADQATAADIAITVANPAPGGGTSTAATFTLTAPTPTPSMTSLNPAQFIAASGSASITVIDSNLSSAQTIDWNSTSLTTSYLYDTTAGSYYLSGVVPAALLATAGTVNVTVVSPTSVPSTSNALPVTIVNPPASTLTGLSPLSGLFHSAVTVTLTGTRFTASSAISINGVVVPSTFVSSTSLTVDLSSADTPLPGNYSFTVATPAPGGGTTTPSPSRATPIAPKITGIAPAVVFAGTSDTVVTVNGTGFSSGSTVELSGTALTTTYLNSATLTATVAEAQLAALGWAPVTVVNPAPGGGTSAALPLSVMAFLDVNIANMRYDPYSRKIMASIDTASGLANADSLVAIDPVSVTIGPSIAIGSQPTQLALTDDGHFLNTILPGSVARFNMVTQQPEYTALATRSSP